MKLSAFLFLAFFAVNTATAQKTFNPANTKNNLKLGLNTSFNDDRFGLAVAWEFKVANRQSVQIELMPIFLRTNYDNTNGLGVALSYRKYISKTKEGLQGIYFSPALKISTLKENYYSSRTPTTTNHLNAAILFGKQWVYKSGFSLDINGGFGYYRYNGYRYRYYYGGYPTNYNDINYGISPNLNIKVGYAF
jgi:hypothetical protein